MAEKECEHLYRDASDKRFCIDCGKDMSKEDKFQKDIRRLEKLAKKLGLKVACDEEWNTIFTNWGIELDEKGKPVIFGFSGSEEEEECHDENED